MSQPQTAEGATETVETVFFSFLTDEEVRNYSFKKITHPVFYDQLERPVPDGLYDPALGPLDDSSPCKSCGQRSFHCPGHCGHIDLILPVYNPLLFRVLHGLIQQACFFCHHFRLERGKVQRYIAQLDLIRKGDIVGAENLDSQLEENGGKGTSAHIKSCSTSKPLEQYKWTSAQYVKAKAVLSKFMKDKPKKCGNCGAKNPNITSPTFGWLYMGAMSDKSIRDNVLRGTKLDHSLSDGAEEGSFNGVEEQISEDMFSEGNNVGPADTELSGAEADEMPAGAKKAPKNGGGRLPLEFLKQKKFFSGHLLPSKVKELLGRLWENEAELCMFVFDIQQESLRLTGNNRSFTIFFMEALLVPPSKFRPPSKGGGSRTAVDHPQSVLLSKVLQSNIYLGNACGNDSQHSKIVPRWMALQQAVNVLFDSKKAMGQKDKVATGICQLLEKKEGIFRQKMMGKRVNFACRSVISPDPYLAVNEIGIPPYFALRLTYPERVTPWNINKMRLAIINGAEIHPGATHYADKSSTIKLPSSRSMRISISRKLPSTRGVVTHPGKSLESEFEGKVVYRHLQDGDIVLVNRQPTLHKPSMMAHVVRVLKGEKTLRMHYANCSTYNADFDGDEMNVHFPQDEIARAEAVNIANANKQYIVPTSGDPIRGLIQDHIISAVLLTKKDTFLTQDEYHQLLYSSGVTVAAPRSFIGKFGKTVSTISSEDEIKPLLPAIWKPRPLWTGKQVITTILNHITRGRPPFTVKKTGKIPKEYFGINNGEIKLLIQKNELVHGVIDKDQFRKYGLVHTVQELYGSDTAGILLSVFSRLFTVFLQMHGFTCGVDDLLIVQELDRERTMKLGDAEKIGERVHSKFVGAKDGGIDPKTLQMEIERVVRSNGDSAIASLDTMMSSALNHLTSEVNNRLFPRGLFKPFPRNCLSLMTTTGAKGGLVNFTQISSLLGQQELEGKRVPRMISGKTLPCFPPWDCASRAGGFISDRFLSGLRPQEYYFHCMAGREGLVDTAIKTSRSGYLQRCLIKNLESLKVCYDHTVRDADGSIIQFCYGEDGVDVHKTSFIAEFKILAANQNIVLEKLSGQLEDAHLSKSDAYIKELPNALESEAKDFFCSLTKKKRHSLHLRKQKNFMNLMKLKYLSSLAQPGEAVGVLAAQSVGEPSTQMTLNTFHLAGRGEMNVTLGIPRLQEILQMASEKIRTPVMTCPLQKGRTRDDAERLAAKLKKITVADIVEGMEVCVVPFSVQNKKVSTIYKLKMKLYPPELYPPHSNITIEDCIEALEVRFLRKLEDTIDDHLKTLFKIGGIKDLSDNVEHIKEKDQDEPSKSQVGEDNDDGGGGDDVDEISEDQGADAQKRKRQATDEMDYEDGIEKEFSVFEDGQTEIEQSAGFESEIDQTEADDDYTLDGVDQVMDGEEQIFDAEDEAPESPSKLEEEMSKSKSSKKKLKSQATKKNTRAKRIKKETDRTVLVVAKGLDFEVHFSFKNEPLILLAEIAQKVAKKVYVKSSGNIERCSVINSTKDSSTPALQTAGVDFKEFWNMHGDLDTNKITSNDIHAMLNTFGVEAARATIINEVKGVFHHYGISVNIRHLTLIADYMTADGGYRPMNRYGMADTSTSPFCKMSFETATRFIVEAALHGELERLESPSARICLGLPVKVGTGCFDLLQNLQV
ncbi:nuclear RNA polymerase A1 [Tasmannia lanceolata]|uniref:nuclear RNA polymerase A1 n=1 Tax=Tasmannia lanceolata TaxID=3420 RepID=UPI004063A405